MLIPPTPKSISSFHQGFIGVPLLDTAVTQTSNGQLTFNWVHFFQRIWQNTQPNSFQVTSGPTFPINLTTGTLTATIFVNKAVGGPTNVLLPALPSLSMTIKVRDAKGDAGTNNITVSGNGNDITAPGGGPTASYVMNMNYQVDSFEWNGQTWSVTGG